MKNRARTLRSLGLTVGGITGLVAVAGLWIAAAGGVLDGLFIAGVAGVLALVVVFTWLVFRVPEHPVSWILLGALACVIVGQMAFLYAEQAVALAWPLPRLALLLSSLGFWPPIVLGAVLLPLLFPTGRPLSPRWRWVGWAATLALVPIVAWVWAVVVTQPVDELVDCIGCEPTGVGAFDLLNNLAQGVILMAAVVAIVSLGIRYRRSADTERKQMQWPALAFAFSIMGLLLVIVGEGIIGGSILGSAGLVLLFAGLAALPAAIVIAITRYRLYDIDRIVNRTLVYGSVVALLAAMYAVIVVGIPALIPATEDRDLLVAAATLAAFFLFNPLRQGVQRLVDRRFYRSRYDAERVVRDFSVRLRDEVDLEVLTREWLDVLDTTLKPSSAKVWLRNSRARAGS